MTKTSSGNPTEYYNYLRYYLKREGYNLENLSYQAVILDYEDWYTSRIKNEKRKGESQTNFTIVHI